MKRAELKVGDFYKGLVNNVVVTVKLDGIREVTTYRGGKKATTEVFDVTNTVTGRQTTFRSAAKFRSPAPPPAKKAPPVPRPRPGGEQRPDPTGTTGSSTTPALPAPTTDGPPEVWVGASTDPLRKGRPMAPELVCLSGQPCDTMANCWCQHCIALRGSPGPVVLPVRPAFKPSPGVELWAVDGGPPLVRPAGGQHGPSPTPGLDELNRRHAPGSYEHTAGLHALGYTSDNPPPVRPVARPVGPVGVARPSFAAHLDAKLAQRKATPAATCRHIMVRALAGTGKTTVSTKGLAKLLGLAPGITPSEEQAAIWDEIMLSKGVFSLGMTSFSNAIVKELRERAPRGVDVKSLHGMGLKAVKGKFNHVQVDEDKVRVNEIVVRLLQRDMYEVRKNDGLLLRACTELADKVCMTLTGWTKEGGWVGPTREEMEELASYYEVELEDEKSGRSYAEQVYDIMPLVLEELMHPERDGWCRFVDMIWLPVVLGLRVDTYDVLVGDEAQDFNRCQQELLMMAVGDTGRLVLVGDENQAIFGFAGADCESMDRMKARLQATPRGLVELPLTETRRCGRAIVLEANQQVPALRAHAGNSDGLVATAAFADYADKVQEGDFVLCRVNAPLVSQCFKFLRANRRANIQGKAVGDQLINLVKRLNVDRVGELLAKVDDWVVKETTKERGRRNPSEARLMNIYDQGDCIGAFTEGLDADDPVAKVVWKIKELFTDDNKPGIRLSSMHKSKGLEARRVWLLMIKGAECPHPMARTPQAVRQEWNLLYVAKTRTIDELYYVSETGTGRPGLAHGEGHEAEGDGGTDVLEWDWHPAGESPVADLLG